MPMRRKKILFVHERYGRYSGAEQHIFVLASHLREFYDLAFLYEQKTGKDEALFNTFFQEKDQIPFDLENGHNGCFPLVDILQKVQPDLIYVNKCLSVPILQTVIQSGIPALRMVHDHEVYCMRTYKYFPWSRRICHKKAGPCCLLPCLAFLQRDRSRGRFGVRWVSYRQKQHLIHLDQQLAAFFVATQYMFDELVLQGYEKTKIFIFPPTPLPIINPKESSFGPENILLFVGLIVRGKGLDCLIQALSHVTKPFKLIVCGEGSHESYCRQLGASLGLDKRIEYQGFVSNEKLPEYYAKASLVAIPSVWPEPMGMIGLEVMRYGLPVVAFDAGGIRDWLHDGKNGFLIPWMDTRTMGEKIEYLLEHKEEARQMGQNGQRIVEEHYNFYHSITTLKSAFTELMEHGAITSGGD